MDELYAELVAELSKRRMTMERERIMWRGQVCTIIGTHARSYDLRDPFGFVVEKVPKRECSELDDSDERKRFSTDGRALDRRFGAIG